MKLRINALTRFVCGLLTVGLLVFLPAGALRYTDGWLLLPAVMLVAGKLFKDGNGKDGMK